MTCNHTAYLSVSLT